jgi:two-component system response regulator VicR
MVKTKKKILIVEDDASISDSYKIILEKSDYTVECAYDGNEGMKKLESFSPDLMLLDLRMPHLDGVGVLTKMTDKQKKDTPVIVLSNYDMQKEIDEAYKLGAERYILKAWASPVDLVQLVKTSLEK